MTEPEVKCGLFFVEETVEIPDDCLYLSCSFDRCNIVFKKGSIFPQGGHFEDCTIEFIDGLDLHYFVSMFVQSFNGALIGGGSTLTAPPGDQTKKNQSGSIYYQCTVLKNGLKYDLKEACYGLLMSAGARDLAKEESDWWEDQEKQRAERRAATE